MTFAFGVTVTVERPGDPDPHGNPTPGTTHTVDACAPAPGGTTERHGSEVTVEWDLDLMVPYGADILPADVVTLPDDATRYQVHGQPKPYRSPFTGWAAGTVVRLKGVSG